MKTIAKEPKPKPRRIPGTRELLIWGVPVTVARAFKMACLARKRSMREMLISLMTAFARQQLPGVLPTDENVEDPRFQVKEPQ